MRREICFVALVLIVGLLCKAQASIVHSSQVHGKFFKMEDNLNSMNEIAGSWRYWLKVHRTIKGDSKLRTKFRKPVDLKRLLMEPEEEKLKKLGLKHDDVKSQPDGAYTLQLATYQSSSSVSAFVKRYWLKQRMPARKIYKTVPKELRLYAGGEFDTREDPLYSIHVVTQGRKTSHLRYGIYENIADAKLDQQILQKHLARFGVQPVIRFVQVTGKLVERIWIAPISGRNLSKWETAE